MLFQRRPPGHRQGPDRLGQIVGLEGQNHLLDTLLLGLVRQIGQLFQAAGGYGQGQPGRCGQLGHVFEVPHLRHVEQWLRFLDRFGGGLHLLRVASDQNQGQFALAGGQPGPGGGIVNLDFHGGGTDLQGIPDADEVAVVDPSEQGPCLLIR